MAKFDPFLSLDCAREEGVGAQSKERKGSNFAAQRSRAIVLQAPRAKHLRAKNLAIAIWQPCQTEHRKEEAVIKGESWLAGSGTGQSDGQLMLGEAPPRWCSHWFIYIEASVKF